MPVTDLRSAVTPWVVLVVLGLMLWASVSPLNPDWFSYQSLYENQGGYLSESGRDPLFIAIMNLWRMLGLDYTGFRVVLACMFGIFAWMLTRGSIIPFALENLGLMTMVVAVLTLLMTRYTVVIREGISVSFLLVGISSLYKRHEEDQGLTAFGRWAAMAWALLASLVHSGVAPIALVLGISAWIRPASYRLAMLLSGILWILVGLFIVVVLAWGNVAEIAYLRFGDRALEAPQNSLGQWALWFAYGGVVVWIARAVYTEYNHDELYPEPIYFLRTVTGPMAMVCILLIYSLLLLGSPTIMINSFVRFLHLILGLGLFAVAVVSPGNRILWLIGLFILMDQVRSIVAAISL